MYLYIIIVYYFYDLHKTTSDIHNYIEINVKLTIVYIFHNIILTKFHHCIIMYIIKLIYTITGD